jgi:membrane glycosyltransferase
MPVQSLTEPGPSPAIRRSSPDRCDVRRAVLLALTLVVTLAAAWMTARALARDTLGPADLVILAAFMALFGWTAFSALTAAAGFLGELACEPSPLGIDPIGPLPRLERRTAILAPVFSEDACAVFARLNAVWESLMATGEGQGFDLFVLSDTVEPDAWAAEERAFEELRRRTAGAGRIYYRRRTHNEGRKAGNIADWVRRFGAAYAHMVVLDADSLMTGECIVRLAGAMEANPAVGLIQTAPVIVNRTSLFGRVQQFASRLYGPLVARGFAWWAGAEGNYWGHNAIIRVQAFAAHAGLPILSGRRPFGGHVMSHDFVEAALMRRAGWAVHMAPELGGSFEECPPTLADYIKRDRRWCHGNLQHLLIAPSRGLHWVSRLHLINGAMAYLSAPAWLALLCLSVLLPAQPELGRASGAPQPAALMSHAGAQDGARWVLAAAIVMLMAPKVLAYLNLLARPEERRRFGGAARALAGVLIEIAVSSLVAPMLMLSQTAVLIQLVSGRGCGWGAQRRSEGRSDIAEAIRGHGGHTAAGLALTLAAIVAAPGTLIWMFPVALGLLASIPLSRWLACCELGAAIRRRGLLLTPEETRPPKVRVRANVLAAEYRAAEAVYGPYDAKPWPPIAAHAAPPEERSFDPTGGLAEAGLALLRGDAEPLDAEGAAFAGLPGALH